MKNFDLAAAKAGAAVCTRSKKPVEIITTNGRAGKFPILAYVDSSVRVRSFSANGQYGYKYESADDLMMRDDDYLEKLARGEYGNHIEDKLEKVDPTIKENLTVDREYWRRVRGWRCREYLQDGIGVKERPCLIALTMPKTRLNSPMPFLKSWRKRRRNYEKTI